MDSMRSLNTSLPRSSPCPQPTEQLLQSFKSAALSVTNLYKNAVSEQSQSRHLGYQDAIEDLLSFLDKENLGLGDGEGWKVRQWATERSDGSGTSASDDDDAERRTRSSSPVASRKEQPETEPTRQASGQASPPRDVQSAPQPPQHPQQQQQPAPTTSQQSNETNSSSRPAVFTFTAGQQIPQTAEQDVDMQTTDDPSSQEDAPVNISVMPPRNSRQAFRHGGHPRSSQRTSTREPSVGLGSKRKFTFPDFFDLSGLGNGRDSMFGGGKRGRFA